VAPESKRSRGYRAGEVLPNGIDFMWANQGSDRNNCWYKNTGVDGTRASVTEQPDPLPSDCSTSVGTGSLLPPPEITDCFLELPSCTAQDTPPRPTVRGSRE
jgi:hypothetical protein